MWLLGLSFLFLCHSFTAVGQSPCLIIHFRKATRGFMTETRRHHNHTLCYGVGTMIAQMHRGPRQTLWKKQGRLVLAIMGTLLCSGLCGLEGWQYFTLLTANRGLPGGQWLRLHAAQCRGPGVSPGQELEPTRYNGRSVRPSAVKERNKYF